jgi:glycerol-3-phosphate dehydrogenase
LERAKINGVEARILSAEEVKALEPNINPEVKGALLCPTGGIVNPFLLSVRAFENAMDNGVKLHLNEEVKGVQKEKTGFLVTTNKGSYQAKVVINAAGLHSDDSREDDRRRSLGTSRRGKANIMSWITMLRDW